MRRRIVDFVIQLSSSGDNTAITAGPQKGSWFEGYTISDGLSDASEVGTRQPRRA